MHCQRGPFSGPPVRNLFDPATWQSREVAPLSYLLEAARRFSASGGVRPSPFTGPRSYSSSGSSRRPLPAALGGTYSSSSLYNGPSGSPLGNYGSVSSGLTPISTGGGYSPSLGGNFNELSNFASSSQVNLGGNFGSLNSVGNFGPSPYTNGRYSSSSTPSLGGNFGPSQASLYSSGRYSATPFTGGSFGTVSGNNRLPSNLGGSFPPTLTASGPPFTSGSSLYTNGGQYVPRSGNYRSASPSSNFGPSPFTSRYGSSSTFSGQSPYGSVRPPTFPSPNAITFGGSPLLNNLYGQPADTFSGLSQQALFQQGGATAGSVSPGIPVATDPSSALGRSASSIPSNLQEMLLRFPGPAPQGLQGAVGNQVLNVPGTSFGNGLFSSSIGSRTSSGLSNANSRYSSSSSLELPGAIFSRGTLPRDITGSSTNRMYGNMFGASPLTLPQGFRNIGNVGIMSESDEGEMKQEEETTEEDEK